MGGAGDWSRAWGGSNEGCNSAIWVGGHHPATPGFPADYAALRAAVYAYADAAADYVATKTDHDWTALASDIAAQMPNLAVNAAEGDFAPHRCYPHRAGGLTFGDLNAVSQLGVGHANHEVFFEASMYSVSDFIPFWDSATQLPSASMLDGAYETRYGGDFTVANQSTAVNFTGLVPADPKYVLDALGDPLKHDLTALQQPASGPYPATFGWGFPIFVYWNVGAGVWSVCDYQPHFWPNGDGRRAVMLRKVGEDALTSPVGCTSGEVGGFSVASFLWNVSLHNDEASCVTTTRQMADASHALYGNHDGYSTGHELICPSRSYTLGNQGFSLSQLGFTSTTTPLMAGDRWVPTVHGSHTDGTFYMSSMSLAASSDATFAWREVTCLQEAGVAIQWEDHSGFGPAHPPGIITPDLKGYRFDLVGDVTSAYGLFSDRHGGGEIIMPTLKLVRSHHGSITNIYTDSGVTMTCGRQQRGATSIATAYGPLYGVRPADVRLPYNLVSIGRSDELVGRFRIDHASA